MLAFFFFLLDLFFVHLSSSPSFLHTSLLLL